MINLRNLQVRKELIIPALLCFIPAIYGFGQQYRAVPLEYPEGNFNSSGLNNSGQICGTALVDLDNFINHAIRYEPDGTFTPLTLGENGESATASAINQHGHVIGTIQTTDFSLLVVIWETDSTFRELSLPEGFITPVPKDLNDKGEAVGHTLTTMPQAYFWDTEGMYHELPQRGFGAEVVALNDSSQLAGRIYDEDGNSIPAVWLPLQAKGTGAVEFELLEMGDPSTDARINDISNAIFPILVNDSTPGTKKEAPIAGTQVMVAGYTTREDGVRSAIYGSLDPKLDYFEENEYDSEALAVGEDGAIYGYRYNKFGGIDATRWGGFERPTPNFTALNLSSVGGGNFMAEATDANAAGQITGAGFERVTWLRNDLGFTDSNSDGVNAEAGNSKRPFKDFDFGDLKFSYVGAYIPSPVEEIRFSDSPEGGTYVFPWGGPEANVMRSYEPVTVTTQSLVVEEGVEVEYGKGQGAVLNVVTRGEIKGRLSVDEYIGGPNSTFDIKEGGFLEARNVDYFGTSAQFDGDGQIQVMEFGNMDSQQGMGVGEAASLLVNQFINNNIGTVLNGSLKVENIVLKSGSITAGNSAAEIIITIPEPDFFAFRAYVPSSGPVFLEDPLSFADVRFVRNMSGFTAGEIPIRGNEAFFIPAGMDGKPRHFFVKRDPNAPDMEPVENPDGTPVRPLFGLKAVDPNKEIFNALPDFKPVTDEENNLFSWRSEAIYAASVFKKSIAETPLTVKIRIPVPGVEEPGNPMTYRLLKFDPEWIYEGIAGKIIPPDGETQDSVFFTGMTDGVFNVSFNGVVLNSDQYLVLATGDPTSGIQDPASQEGAVLKQNQPNPFHVSTRIDYSLSGPARVSLSVYNALGQQVRSLVEEIQPPGAYPVEWDGSDDSGVRLSEGVYFYRIRIIYQDEGLGVRTYSRKMILR